MRPSAGDNAARRLLYWFSFGPQSTLSLRPYLDAGAGARDLKSLELAPELEPVMSFGSTTLVAANNASIVKQTFVKKSF